MVSLVLYSLPLAVYAFVVRRKEGVGWGEIASRLGLTWGDRRSYLWAAGFALLGCAMAWGTWHLIPAAVLEDRQIALGRFAGQRLTWANLWAVLLFGLFETSLGEELFFRGLIAGWLGRRQTFWMANGIQATIFTLPPLLILAVDARLWPLAVALPFASGLMFGWLRLRSGSVLPGWLVHGISNVVSAMLVAV